MGKKFSRETVQMKLTTQLATKARELYFGGNSTGVCLKEKIADVNFEESIRIHQPFHPISALLFHINYYVTVTSKVLQGGPLDGHDKYSFDVPPINNQKDWEDFQSKCWFEANSFADSIERLSEDQLWEDFVKPKYGSYFRCINGTIEHGYYHLGQIAIVKSLVGQNQT